MKNKKTLFCALAAFAFSSLMLQSFVDTELDPGVGVKCKKIDDSEVYCKDGSDFKTKCATTTGTDNC
ncbi:hypothetical protein [Pedobacter jamesrossensis]|uniref:Uncharacterized protein n=1 Tax=Pedobacter jamesrossensis TaxID=1908238 RepID=A0ABV8NIC9_9SPHI